MVETARDQHRAAPPCPQRMHQHPRARRRGDALGKTARDGILFQSGEQCDPLRQRLGKRQFAAHGAFGDVGDLGLQSGEVRQLVDAFLPDHGRVHVGNEQVRGGKGPVAHQQVAQAEMRVEYGAQLGRIPVRQRELQHRAVMLQHPLFRHAHARRFEGGDSSARLRFNVRHVCYKPRDEHG